MCTCPSSNAVRTLLPTVSKQKFCELLAGTQMVILRVLSYLNPLKAIRLICYPEFFSLFLLCSIILETDANVIAGKVASHSIDAAAPLSEQVLLLFLNNSSNMSPSAGRH